MYRFLKIRLGFLFDFLQISVSGFKLFLPLQKDSKLNHFQSGQTAFSGVCPALLALIGPCWWLFYLVEHVILALEPISERKHTDLFSPMEIQSW